MVEETNEGILLVKSEFVGFLDSKTIPKKNWVTESLSKLEENYQFVFGKYTINESEWFPKILRACTNGLKATDCLPGSVTSKRLLERVNGFNKTMITNSPSFNTLFFSFFKINI